MASLSLRNLSEAVSSSRTRRQAALQDCSLGDKVRLMMRNVPHPLMIITAGNGQETDKVGMLVSSFNTVTLSPDPIITFNIKLPSSTYSAIDATGHFSVLAPASVEQARSYSIGLAAAFGTNASIKNPDAPDSRIKLKSQSAFEFHCRWLREKSIEIGDHVVMVGQVLSVSNNQMEDEVPRALIYSNGQYRYAGNPIES